MNYTEALDSASVKRVGGDVVHLNQILEGCRVGEVYPAEMLFRVIGISMNGTDIEILKFKKEQEREHEGAVHYPQVVPSPS